MGAACPRRIEDSLRGGRFLRPGPRSGKPVVEGDACAPAELTLRAGWIDDRAEHVAEPRFLVLRLFSDAGDAATGRVQIVHGQREPGTDVERSARAADGREHGVDDVSDVHEVALL